MADIQFSSLLLVSISFPLFFFFWNFLKSFSSSSKLPTSYPILGSLFTIRKNKRRRVQWLSDIVRTTPNLTFTLHRPLGYCQIFTANPANVQHILKTQFNNYPKGEVFRTTLRDFLGDGIFNIDGQDWKFQRQLSSHQFNTRSLRKFVETVVDSELSDRLYPILRDAAANKTVLDFQDILQRFAFDNICKIAFGYDPAYLLPSLPEAEFAVVFAKTLDLISERFNSNIPLVWKIKRALNIGNESRLKSSVAQIREFAKGIIREKKQQLIEKSSLESEDLLSRFLSSGHSDEDFITDVVISFILAGRDTTSAALTWFFWLLFKNPQVEKEIMKEIADSRDEHVYDEVKSMVYTHASLCETMRLYPPVPVTTKFAANDDVLPDGTVVKKGTRLGIHTYAMGRVERIWGTDWGKFRPERWLENDCGNRSFIGRDSYTYPVFQAGPRICLGKEMAFLQMKRVATGVLRRFRVVPAFGGSGDEPYAADMTSKMEGGLMARILERE